MILSLSLRTCLHNFTTALKFLFSEHLFISLDRPADKGVVKTFNLLCYNYILSPEVLSLLGVLQGLKGPLYPGKEKNEERHYLIR